MTVEFFLIGLCIIAQIVAVGMFHVKTRRLFLLMNAAVAGCYIPYLYLFGAESGALVLALISIGCLLQATLGENQDEKTKYWRIGFLMASLVIGLPLVFSGWADLLPALAFIVGRTAESQSSKDKVVFWFMPVGVFWLLYYGHEGVLLFFIGTLFTFASNLYAGRKQIKDVLNKTHIWLRSYRSDLSFSTYP